MVAVDAGRYQVGEKVVLYTDNIDEAEGWDDSHPYTIARIDEESANYCRYYFEERPGWYLYDDQFTWYVEPEDEPIGEVPPCCIEQAREKTYALPENTNPPTLANLEDAVDLSNYFDNGGFVDSRVGEESEEPLKVTENSWCFSFTLGTPITDPINPDYYKFPGGAEVIDISEHLTGNGAQVVQYVARSTRLDGKNKGDQIENLKKARFFLEREIARLEGSDD